MRRPRAIFKSKAVIRGVEYVKVTTGLPAGGRTRHFFKTDKEADTFIDQRTVEVLNHGSVGASVPTKLRFQALEAEKLLEPYGITILEAAKHYVVSVERIK